jgi:hypothetical protein
MLPERDQWRGRIQDLDLLSPAATSLRYPTAEGRIMPPPIRELVEREIGTVIAFIQDVRRTVSAASG